jgi:integrase
MKFTTATIAALKIERGKAEQRVFDDDVPGFGVRLRDTGGRTWIVQYRNRAGKSQTKPLGSLNKLSLAQARQLAKADLAKITLHGDPQKDKKQERTRAAQTLDSTAQGFLEHQRVHLKPQSFEQVETHLTKHWQPLGAKSIHDITAFDVSERLGKIAKERGPYAANRARSTLSSFYAWAIGEGVAHHNPVVGTKRRTKETPRDRVLSDSELVAIWKACNGDDHGLIVRLLILTGQRRDEVGAMTRSEISIADRKWSIPRERTKNGRPHSVALSDPAIAILTTALKREGREDREAVFGEGNSGRGFSGWSKCKERLDARIAEATQAKPADWRLHDLRRTAATRMAELGVLPHVIEACLNHISGHKAGIAGVYNRAVYAAETRTAFDLWGAHVEALLAGKRASNVTLMRKA